MITNGNNRIIGQNVAFRIAVGVAIVALFTMLNGAYHVIGYIDTEHYGNHQQEYLIHVLGGIGLLAGGGLLFIAAAVLFSASLRK